MARTLPTPPAPAIGRVPLLHLRLRLVHTNRPPTTCSRSAPLAQSRCSLRACLSRTLWTLLHQVIVSTKSSHGALSLWALLLLIQVLDVKCLYLHWRFSFSIAIILPHQPIRAPLVARKSRLDGFHEISSSDQMLA
jgi:hypothetical protein